MRLPGTPFFPWFVRLCAGGLAWSALLVAGPVRAPAQQAAQEYTADPSELFLKAFTAVQQGEKLETDGRLKPALAKYRFAASVLEQVGQNHPNWQPLIVSYRLRKTAENIHQLEQKIYLQPANNGGISVSGATPDGEDADLPREDDPLPGLGETPARRSPPAFQAPGDAPAFNPPVGGPPEPSREAIDRATQELKARLEKSEKDLKAARDQLTAAQKDKQQTLKEKKNLEFELESTRTEMRSAQKKVERARANREEAETDLEKAQKRLKDLIARNPSGTEESRRELREQVAQLKQSLAKADAAAEAAAKDKDTLAARLTESEGRSAELTRQRDALVASGSSPDVARTIETLQTQNAELTQKLTTAETRIAELNAESARRGAEVEGMTRELTTLKDQLAASRDQNDRNATTITELKTQLDASAESIKALKATGATGEDFSRMNKENELLRGIVMRQLKDQARRVASKKLVTDELARLEVQSKTLTDQIALLGQPSQPLSDDERALFKEPSITISDTSDPNALATSIMAIKPRSGPPGAQGNGPAEPVDGGGAGGPAVSVPGAAEAAAKPPEAPAKPKVAEAQMALAQEAENNFKQNKYPEAEKIYDKLLAREPKNPYLLSNQGVVLFRQDKLKMAEVMLKKAAAISPDDAFAQATLGIIYYRMHRYDDAIDALTKAIRIDPKNATAHNYLGITSSQKGWPEAALDEEQKALSLNPNYADAHFNIAVIYATTQPPSKDRALEHYRKATQLGAMPDPELEKLLQN